jgi:hypothetical protein
MRSLRAPVCFPSSHDNNHLTANSQHQLTQTLPPGYSLLLCAYQSAIASHTARWITTPPHSTTKQQHLHDGPVPRPQRTRAFPRPRKIRKLTSRRLRPHHPSNLLPKHLRLRRAAATTQHPLTSNTAATSPSSKPSPTEPGSPTTKPPAPPSPPSPTCKNASSAS